MGRRHYSSPYGPEVEAFVICVLLFIAGFFTFGIAWIGLAMVLALCVSRNPISAKRRKQNRNWLKSWLKSFGDVLTEQAEGDVAEMPRDTPDKPKRQEHEWPHLSKIRKAEEARRKQQEADEALKYAGTPDKPYVQKLTAEEQALKEKVEAAIQRAESAPIDDKPIEKRGPRGGRYTEDQTKDGRPYRRYF